MAQETTPGSVQTTDNLRIAVVPVGSNALSAAILEGGTTKLITYSLTPDGWSFPINETEIEDKRLTLAQSGSVPGTTKVGPIVLKYVYGSGSDVAKAALVPGTRVKLTIRDALPNATVFAAAQTVDTVTVRAGAQRKDAPAADGFFTISQTLYVEAGSYLTNQTVVA